MNVGNYACKTERKRVRVFVDFANVTYINKKHREFFHMISWNTRTWTNLNEVFQLNSLISSHSYICYEIGDAHEDVCLNYIKPRVVNIQASHVLNEISPRGCKHNRYYVAQDFLKTVLCMDMPKVGRHFFFFFTTWKTYIKSHAKN